MVVVFGLMKRRETKMIITAGATIATTASTPVETVSFSLWGKEMLGSVREKGRWLGVVWEKPKPMRATPLEYY